MSETEDYGGKETYQLVSDGVPSIVLQHPTQKINEKIFSPEDRPIGHGEYHITDLDGADWYLKIMGGYEDEIARIEKQYQSMIASIRSKMKGFAYRYKAEFEHTVAQHLATLKSGKSVQLWHGTIQMRTVPESWSVSNESEAISFVESDEVLTSYQLVSTVKVLNKTAFKALAKVKREESGELIPGIEIKPERQSLSYPGRIELDPDYRPGEGDEE